MLFAMTQQLDLKQKTISLGKASRKAEEKAAKAIVEKPAESMARKRLPLWASFLIATNGMVLLGVSLFTARPDLANRLLNDPRVAPIVAKVWPNRTAIVQPSPVAEPETLPETARTILSYEQWLDVLKQEAITVSTKSPERLTVLLGDSLSLWFPPEQLPGDRSWLNQGISGETTAAMLKRLSFLDATKPQTILIMAGINDLKSGVSEADLLTNYRTMIQTLKQKHPETELVVQSILPHSGAAMTAEEADRLRSIPNEQIFRLNQKLATIAKEEQALFLNLHPLFADPEGMLRSDLTTDGLHLSPAGYLVWSTALQTFSQTQLRNNSPSELATQTETTADAPKAESTPEVAKPTEEPKPAQ